MKFYILVTVFQIFAFIKVQGYARTCRYCTGYSSSRSGFSCITNGTSVSSQSYCRSGHYCLTEVDYNRGILYSVRRKCQSPYTDYDSSTSRPPSGNVCYSTYSTYGATGSVTCYYPCNYTNCNNISANLPTISTPSPTISPTKPPECPSECPLTCDRYKRCLRSSLKCVQCNSNVDPNCETKTTATPCGSTYINYCSVSNVSTFDVKQGKLLRSTVTKSCASVSSTNPVGRCSLSIKSNAFNQPVTVNYDCDYYCNTNGCNVKYVKDTVSQTPSSVQSQLYCVVCTQKGSQSGSSCSTQTSSSLCPSSSKYCKTTVRYYLRKDSSSAGQIAYLERGCATQAVDTKCETSKVDDTDLEVVTCQETCKTYGCNTGWPARPRCSKCRSLSTNKNAFEECLKSPPLATMCSSPAEAYCMKSIKNMDNVEGYSREIIRQCTYGGSAGSTCHDNVVGDTTLRNCHTYCNTDSCNLGVPAGSSAVKSSLLIMFVTFVISIL